MFQEKTIPVLPPAIAIAVNRSAQLYRDILESASDLPLDFKLWLEKSPKAFQEITAKDMALGPVGERLLELYVHAEELAQQLEIIQQSPETVFALHNAIVALKTNNRDYGRQWQKLNVDAISKWLKGHSDSELIATLVRGEREDLTNYLVGWLGIKYEDFLSKDAIATGVLGDIREKIHELQHRTNPQPMRHERTELSYQDFNFIQNMNSLLGEHGDLATKNSAVKLENSLEALEKKRHIKEKRLADFLGLYPSTLTTWSGLRNPWEKAPYFCRDHPDCLGIGQYPTTQTAPQAVRRFPDEYANKALGKMIEKLFDIFGARLEKDSPEDPIEDLMNMLEKTFEGKTDPKTDLTTGARDSVMAALSEYLEKELPAIKADAARHVKGGHANREQKRRGEGKTPDIDR